MKVLIEKELCNPDEQCNIAGPYYHIYTVRENGEKTFIKTFDGDIKEAARYAERELDSNALEVVFKNSKETITPPVHSIPIVVERLLPNIEKIVSREIVTDRHFYEIERCLGNNELKMELKHRSAESIVKLLIDDDKYLDFKSERNPETGYFYLTSTLYLQKLKTDKND